MADETADSSTTDRSWWTKVVQLAAGIGTVTATITSLAGNRVVAATAATTALLAVALVLLRFQRPLRPTLQRWSRISGGSLAAVVLLTYSLAWYSPTSRNWLIHRSAAPLEAWRLSDLQPGRLRERQALATTVTSANDARIVERVSIIEYFTSGSVTAGTLRPEGCGGRDFDLFVLSDATLIEPEGGADVYRLSQTRDAQPDAMVADAYGQWESFFECDETLYIDTHPGLPIAAGDQRSMAFSFDGAMHFDKHYLYPLEGPPQGPETADVELPLLAAGSSPDSQISAYFRMYTVHIVGLAAHSDAGDCATTALSIDVESGVATKLAPDLLINDTTLSEWLCNFTELPSGGESALP